MTPPTHSTTLPPSGCLVSPARPTTTLPPAEPRRPGPSLFSPLLVNAAKGKRVRQLAWSGVKDQPLLLAAALEGGTVVIVKEDGELYQDIVIKAKSPGANATSLSWAPVVQTAGGLLLAIGWEDGTVMVWSEKDVAVREDADAHAPHPIGFALWSPDGTRLITGDARAAGAGQQDTAVLAVWKVDNRGRFSTICTYRRSATGALTHAIFRTEGVTKKVTSSMFAAAECPPFYFGGETGAISHGDAMGHSSDAIPSAGSPVAAMLYHVEKDALVVISKAHTLSQYTLVDNKPKQTYKAKLSVGRDGLLDAIWAGDGQLALVSADQVVRVYNLPQDDNYVLSLVDVPGADGAASADEHTSDHLVSLAFHKECALLAAGTREGRVVIWRRSPVPPPQDAPERAWEPLPPVGVGSQPDTLVWAPREKLLGVGGAASLSLMPETVLRRCMSGAWVLTQLTPHRLQLESDAGVVLPLETPLRVRGCDMQAGHIVLWSSAHVQIFEFDHESPAANPPRQSNSFDKRCMAVGIWGESLYVLTPGRIEVANFAGVVKSTLPFMDSEGHPIVLGINGTADGTTFLAAGTDRGWIKAWDLSRREPRQHAAGKKLLDANTTVASRVTSVQIAADGSRVSATLEAQQPAAPPKGGGLPGGNKGGAGGGVWVDPATLYVYLVDADVVQSFDFGAIGRVPGSHFWDPSESKLLGVETRPAAPAATAPAAATGSGVGAVSSARDSSAGGESEGSLEVTTMFSTTEVGLKMKNSVAVDEGFESLVGVQVPRFYFVAKGGAAGAASSGAPSAAPAAAEEGGGKAAAPPKDGRLRTKVMLDFVGMEDVDAATQHALLDFSYYLTIGNMDEAHRAVKLIKQTSVWENMARMCVKTKRLDVAEVCLGHMGHARGARAVRDVVAQYKGDDGVVSEPDVCAAMVAVQLGLIDEAEKLYAGCGRHDLLNQLYQCSGQWEKAVQLAEEKDRIHLKSTHYLYARQLEALGSHTDAIVHYEASGTHVVEVPRMLFDAQQMAQLQAYIDDLQDKGLFKWWAQYAESNQQFDLALEYYGRAGDTLASVRVLCFQGQLERAAELVSKGEGEGASDHAAAYHLARQYEAQDAIKEAVFFYQRAKRFNHAARLAKAHGMTGELTMLAAQANPKEMIESAAYFEERNMPDKAVALYQKAGNTSRAIDLCFRHRLFDSLRDIADSLNASTDPQLLHRCAEFFLDHGQYEKTVHLFTQAGECTKALDLCVLHNIPLSEETAEAMVPPLGEPGAETDEARQALLAKVAKCCKRQGNYHLASKKYVQAGDKLKAMKCLLKSGDTEKIIFFAGVSRTREIYILAANYLQTLDWHSDPEIMKNIVAFYTKAKAFENLSAFYDACAQVEIDEYRDYEKALGALREAQMYLTKARVQGKEDKLASLQQRVAHVDGFVSARKMVKTEPNEMVAMCHQLLEQPDVEAAIRVGDVYALMVEWFYSQRQMEQAHVLVEQMRGRGIILSPYLDQEMVHAIYGAMGLPVAQDPAPPPGGDARGSAVGVEEEMEEQIDEQDDDDE